jgi:hypothetical protein
MKQFWFVSLHVTFNLQFLTEYNFLFSKRTYLVHNVVPDIGQNVILGKNTMTLQMLGISLNLLHNMLQPALSFQCTIHLSEPL